MGRPWVVRAGLLTLVHVAVRTGLGFAALAWPTAGQSQRITGLCVVLAVAVFWGGLDALRENRAAADRDDLLVRWLVAAVVAGPVAGLVFWAVEGLFIDAVGTSQLFSDVVGGGAFTALLIFVPAVVGMLFGRVVRPGRVRARA